MAEDGTAFVSDSRAGRIYRIAGDGAAEAWLELGGEGNPNGLLVHEDRLLVALNPVHRVIAVDLDDRERHHLAMLPPGIIDGLEPLGNGAVLASGFDGKLFRIGPDGEVSKLYDSSTLDRPCADIEFVPERNMVLIPTYLEGQVVALQL